MKVNLSMDDIRTKVEEYIKKGRSCYRSPRTYGLLCNDCRYDSR